MDGYGCNLGKVGSDPNFGLGRIPVRVNSSGTAGDHRHHGALVFGTSLIMFSARPSRSLPLRAASLIAFLSLVISTKPKPAGCLNRDRYKCSHVLLLHGFKKGIEPRLR